MRLPFQRKKGKARLKKGAHKKDRWECNEGKRLGENSGPGMQVLEESSVKGRLGLLLRGFALEHLNGQRAAYGEKLGGRKVETVCRVGDPPLGGKSVFGSRGEKIGVPLFKRGKSGMSKRNQNWGGSKRGGYQGGTPVAEV